MHIYSTESATVAPAPTNNLLTADKTQADFDATAQASPERRHDS